MRLSATGSCALYSPRDARLDGGLGKNACSGASGRYSKDSVKPSAGWSQGTGHGAGSALNSGRRERDRVMNQTKISAAHLKRSAYLYVRQSTLRQVVENQESTHRQYALRDKAVALGWAQDQIVVVDSDLGLSGASATDREGFQRLVAEVGMGRVGIVLGLEVSRLARNCSDWHRLLEICALTGTLLLDEDGLYDPGHFNDRLVLGLKGTMSEAELHVLRARLQGGLLNKARRGELWTPIPMGFVYGPKVQVLLDPDRQIQGVIRQFFDSFQRLHSAHGVAKEFREKGILFPTRAEDKGGSQSGELRWRVLTPGRAASIVKNPRYAGAYFFGAGRQFRNHDGCKKKLRLPQQDWQVLIQGAHEGYISWDQFQENQQSLSQNCRNNGRLHPVREGPALLQGLILCGICGARITPHYSVRANGHVVPFYECVGEARSLGPRCQSFLGEALDAAISELLLNTVTPLAMEAALSVQEELQRQLGAADGLRRQQVERAQYEADLARRRFMQVDPAHRLVADTLEADWNAKLRLVQQAQEEYESRRETDRRTFQEEQLKAVRELASDFPRLWNCPAIPHQERKRMVRLLLEDVTVIRADCITAHVRFRGGATTTLTLPLAVSSWARRRTKPEMVELVDSLLSNYAECEIANILNQRGLRSSEGREFSRMMVHTICRNYRLKPRRTRLREQGFLTIEEICQKLAITKTTAWTWRQKGRLKALRVHGRVFMYEDPTVKKEQTGA